MPVKTGLYLVILLAFIFSPSPVLAATSWEECAPQGVATLKCLEVVFGRIVSFAAGGALIAFFVMFIIAAFKYLTSGGDPKQTESAKNTMTYAFIGIIVIVAAYIIIRFLEVFTGLSLSEFVIPEP